ncbi:S41 family peptidase [Niastella koreensis]|uniref:S41 family peptidase n=1 Tax=Niastella koreensis TaxID=354356 RepID=UPI0021D1C286|nr:S41 family peptidase [Niastella koreensis]
MARNSKGKLIVLIGKLTFSSAIMNAIELKRGTNAILVGEPTSGSVNHYGEVRAFRLPHTKIIIGYSTRVSLQLAP